jgi:hypothetical protein
VSDKLRCINAFEYDGRIYPGGIEVDGDAAILETHSAHFGPVVTIDRTFSAVRATETATAAPGEPRSLATPGKRGPGRPRKQQDLASPEVTPPAVTKVDEKKDED